MTAYEELRRVHDQFHPLLLEGSSGMLVALAADWVNSGLTVAVASGHRMRTDSALFDEFAHVLRFPEYFGHNRDAFNECLADLEGLPAGVGYVIVVTEPDEILADVGSSEFDWVGRSFAFAKAEWARPIEQGEWWDRPALAFNLVLAGQRDALERAQKSWTAVGFPPVALAR